MKRSTLIGLMSVAGLAVPAFALSDGDILLTNFNLDCITLIENPGGSNTATNLIFFNDIPSGGGGDNPVRLSDIVRGPGGEYYVGDGSFITGDDFWDTSRIIRIDGLLSGAPTHTNFLTGAGAGALMNPVGMRYDENYGGLLWVQNPFKRLGPAQVVEDGIYGSTLGAPNANLFFAEDTSGPRPFYEAGFYMEREPGRNSYLVASLNGGDLGGFSDARASTLWRFTPDYGNPGNSTMELVHDFSDPVAANMLVQFRGITAGPNPGEYFITNTSDGDGAAGGPYAVDGVYRLLLDGSGAFQSLTLVSTAVTRPEAIIYNPFHNKLVVGSSTNTAGGIWQMDLDGSNVELLLADTHARGFSIVPTPGAISLLGIGGLMAFRRRR